MEEKREIIGSLESTLCIVNQNSLLTHNGAATFRIHETKVCALNEATAHAFGEWSAADVHQAGDRLHALAQAMRANGPLDYRGAINWVMKNYATTQPALACHAAMEIIRCDSSKTKTSWTPTELVEICQDLVAYARRKMKPWLSPWVYGAARSVAYARRKVEMKPAPSLPPEVVEINEVLKDAGFRLNALGELLNLHTQDDVFLDLKQVTVLADAFSRMRERLEKEVTVEPLGAVQ